MKKRRRKKYQPVDILTIFFEDVARSTVVAGKSDYLPLTRRIERGRVLLELHGDNVSETTHNLNKELRQSVSYLSKTLPLEIVKGFLTQATEEIEIFLDNPQLDEPSSVCELMAHVSKVEDDERLQLRLDVWRCFYLLSLLPYQERLNWEITEESEEFTEHFQTILNEYESSKLMLIEGTLRYAIRLARYYIRTDIPFIDLIQEGFIGLLYALDKFQEAVGAHFQSYAATWIRQRIMRYIADYSRIIRVPVHQHEKAKVIYQAHLELVEELNREPDDYELFLYLEWLTEDDFVLLEQHKEQERYRKTVKKFSALQSLLEYRDKTISNIPKDLKQKILDIEEAYCILGDELGFEPDDITLFQSLDWLTAEEVSRLQEGQVQALNTKKLTIPLSKLYKANIQMTYYRMAYAKHYSTETPLKASDGRPLLEVENYLCAGDDTECTGDKNVLVDEIQTMLHDLRERERQVINLRFGLIDGEEHTLEDVGGEFGITRERVRQIESKALKRLRRASRNRAVAFFINPETSNIPLILERTKRRLRRMFQEIDPYVIWDDNDYLVEQEAHIDKIIEKYVMQGRQRIGSKRTVGLRAQVFRRILNQEKEPMHYKTIHDKALDILPPTHHSSEKTSYATLFQNDLFQLMGNGVFGLIEWDMMTVGSRGEKIFTHCPQPLLPHNADNRAFFESIMIGRELLKQQHQMDVNAFYSRMQAWAGRSEDSLINLQNSMDAWYASGLIEYVDVTRDNHALLHLTIQPDIGLHDVRMHCLNALCHRVLKMPELLLTLKQIARPTILDIQKVLFGNDRAGFDVPYRLTMLTAFEAVWHTNDEWRLTPVGDAILEANPPQELPDFSIIDEITAETEEDDNDELLWEDQLGLLDI